MTYKNLHVQKEISDPRMISSSFRHNMFLYISCLQQVRGIRRYCCEGAIATFNHLVADLYFSYCFCQFVIYRSILCTLSESISVWHNSLIKGLWIGFFVAMFDLCIICAHIISEIFGLKIQLKSTNNTNLQVGKSIGVLFSHHVK